MTIYTGRGDDGMTDLRGGERVEKRSHRIEAYGSVDELNALVGTVRATGFEDLDGWLRSIQNHLHVIQAQLASRDEVEPSIDEEDIQSLEHWIDTCEDELDPLTSFILPTGGDTGAGLHHARAVCRRVERRVNALDEVEEVPNHVLAYLNRLSDALFVFARVANARENHSEEAPSY